MYFPKIPVKFQHLLGPGSIVQTVNVLSDHDTAVKEPFEFHNRPVTSIRFNPGNELPPPVIPFPHFSGICSKGCRRRQFLDTKFVPNAISTSENRHTTFCRDSGSCENNNTSGWDE
jgi:hypothetical protein